MDTLRSVLEEIQAGTTVFRPAGTSERDMWDFQPIAKMLEYAQDEGLLANCVAHRESDSAHGWYDLILVRGGLSYKGERFLADERRDTDKKLAEIIQLKPTIYGIGVDLKAIWERWKDRKK